MEKEIKTEMCKFRTTPEFKKIVQKAAKDSTRTESNLLELATTEYLIKHKYLKK